MILKKILYQLLSVPGVSNTRPATSLKLLKLLLKLRFSLRPLYDGNLNNYIEINLKIQTLKQFINIYFNTFKKVN